MKRTLTVAIFLFFAAGLAAQGITLKSKAQVLYGSASTCSQPATVRFSKVRSATPEWKKIRSEGVRKGSARYQLLISNMMQRIKRAAKAAAQNEGRDCVVRKGDIKEDNGLSVVDLTDNLLGELSR